jgi:hypothetical protein
MIRIYSIHGHGQDPYKGIFAGSIKSARAVAATHLRKRSVKVWVVEVLISEIRITSQNAAIFFSAGIKPHTFIKYRVLGTSCGKCPGCNSVTGQLTLFDEKESRVCENRKIEFKRR